MVVVEEVEEAEETEEVVEVEGPAECCRCTVRRLFELAEICSIESFKNTYYLRTNTPKTVSRHAGLGLG
jgi:hypothetical protein